MLQGKLPARLLKDLLAAIPVDDPDVIVGPRFGEDAAVLDIGDRYLIAKSDPITFTAHRIGWYALQINANDVATMGARPRWFLGTLLLPPSSAEQEVQQIFVDIREACRSLGVTLVGGHTEVTDGVERPILAGTLLGEVAKERLVVNANARPGDIVLLTQGIAIEGTAILAQDASAQLAEQGLSDATIKRAQAYLDDPGISVVPAAEALCRAVRPRAMHDPTEGGLATALTELAAGAACGMTIDLDTVPLLPETAEICDALGLDPLGLLASGSLLAVVAPKDVLPALKAFEKAGAMAAAIGRLTEPEQGLRMLADGDWHDIPSFPRDELARFFDEGVEAGP
ncbi:MAG: AIR synthase family protein [Chloroflexota bacterium]|nr:AIR synthase family protein [Chloroflexota bacterium]MDE2841232.1 AIR synthase family protein [Chloroflexota bacterium]MDE2930430.1 AIR synthase family protein [Chloroflexota bacterium]